MASRSGSTTLDVADWQEMDWTFDGVRVFGGAAERVGIGNGSDNDCSQGRG